MVAKLNNTEATRSGTGICLMIPELLNNKPLRNCVRAASNVAAFAAAPLGVVVNLGYAGRKGIAAHKIIRNNEQATRFTALKGEIKTHLAFAGLDTAVAVVLFFASWKVLAVICIVRQIKPNYAILAYKNFNVLATQGWSALRRHVLES